MQHAVRIKALRLPCVTTGSRSVDAPEDSYASDEGPSSGQNSTIDIYVFARDFSSQSSELLKNQVLQSSSPVAGSRATAIG